jgi:16S rRNA (cytosine1402-N4)-methyltransferase
LEYLEPQRGDNFIDATIGFGGHSSELLKKILPEGRLLGIDLNKETLKILENEKRPGLVLRRGNYADLKKIAEEEKFYPIKGILFDLGISSWALEKSGKGFSFQKDEPLDMRVEENNQLTAAEIVNSWPEEKLLRIFWDYGEERYGRRIVKNIIRARAIRPLQTTGELVEIIRRSTPAPYRRRRLHFATKVFQALRIAVNGELDNLKNALPQALEILEKQGRLAVISFHSLEDRIVKNFFREKAKENYFKILTKKPITPLVAETGINPRSRSAKLRVAEKL